MNNAIDIERSATVVITHQVSEANAAEYESWLKKIVPVCKTYPGHLGAQIIQGSASALPVYTIVIRFDHEDHLHAWTHSHDRKRLIAEVQPLLVDGDKLSVLDGLDYWFVTENTPTKPPKKWKQFLVTWSAIYPLVAGGNAIILYLLQALSLPGNRYFSTLLLTGVVVALMTYVVMPRYTRAIHHWLFR